MADDNNITPIEAETDGNEYNPNIVTIIDEQGAEHFFEELDRIETEDGKFIALLPVYDEAEEIIDDDGALIILSVIEEGDETFLEPITDDEIWDSVAPIFEERLADIFEFDSPDGADE